MNRNSSKISGGTTSGGLRGQQKTGRSHYAISDRPGAQLLGRAQAQRSQPHSLVRGRTHPHPRRILMTADCIGGVWTYALDLARELALDGVHIIIATMGDLPTDVQRQEAHTIPNLTLCASGFKLEWMPDCWLDVERAGEWLLDLEAQFAPDLIHLNGYAHATLAWKAPVLVVAHSCVLSWWRAVKSEDAPSEWHTYRQAVTRGLASAHTVVAPTRAMLATLAAHYGPLPSSCVIANGRHAAPYQSARKEPFILTAGRLWDEAKNVDALRQAAPRLAWPVYAAGCSGSEMIGEHTVPGTGNVPGLEATALPSVLADAMRATLVRQDVIVTAALSQTTGCFRPLGRLAPSELAAWYARAAIYALPARYEPFGLSALEAALSGCALALGDIASLREVWGDAALFVPPDDTDALCRALNRLITNPELRRDMAERARERALQYSLRAMTNAYLDCYAAMLPPACAQQFIHESPTLAPLDHIDVIEDDELWYQREWQSEAEEIDRNEDAPDNERQENITDRNLRGPEGTQA